MKLRKKKFFNKKSTDRKQDRRLAKIERALSHEIKVYSGSVTAAALAANTPVLDYLHLVPASASQRVGLKIKILRIVGTFFYYADAQPPTDTSTLQGCRHIQYSVGHNNEQAVAITDIITSGTVNGLTTAPANPLTGGQVGNWLGKKAGDGMINVSRDKKFFLSFLNDSLVNAADTYSITSTSFNPPAKLISVNRIFPKGHHVNFSDATTDPPTITTTMYGALGVASLSEGGDVSYRANWAVYYVDN